MANKKSTGGDTPSHGDKIIIGNIGAGASVAAGSGASATTAHDSPQLTPLIQTPTAPATPAQQPHEVVSDADRRLVAGRYQLIKKLGAGGMAEVHQAFQPRLERNVAIKFIRSDLATNQSFQARFEREAKAIAHLSHGNIVHIYDFGVYDQRYYLVMEFIDGCALSACLRPLAVAGKRLTKGQILWLIQQIGAALDYAHQRGIIHRDIKPDNIMLSAEGRVVLTDFGIAKILEDADELTRTGAILGTPAYMSPEQIEGQKNKIGPATDLYSLGIMLYQLVTGQRPFNASTSQALMRKHLYEPVPPPRTLDPTLPEALERLILKALEKDPANRYQSAKEFVTDLQQAIDEAPVPIAPITAPSATASRKQQTSQTRIWSQNRKPAPSLISATVPAHSARPYQPNIPPANDSQQTTIVESVESPSLRKPFWRKVPWWLWALAGLLLLIIVGAMVLPPIAVW